MTIVVDLTLGADLVLPSSEDQLVRATGVNFNANDSLSGGLGTDTLFISGGGTFDLLKLAVFEGFEFVIMESDGNVSPTIIMNAGIYKLLLNKNFVNSDGYNVVMSSGNDFIVGSVGKDLFIPGIGQKGNGFDQDYLDGGGGYDILDLQYGLLEGPIDSTSMVVKNVEELRLGSIRFSNNNAFESFSGLKRISGQPANSLFSPFKVDRDVFDLKDLELLTQVYFSYFESVSINGTNFIVHNENQLEAVKGGSGSDTISSDFLVNFKQKQSAFSRSVENIKDPSGLYFTPFLKSFSGSGSMKSTGIIGDRYYPYYEYWLTNDKKLQFDGQIDTTVINEITVYGVARGAASGPGAFFPPTPLELARVMADSQGYWGAEIDARENLSIYYAAVKLKDGTTYTAGLGSFAFDYVSPEITATGSGGVGNFRSIKLSGIVEGDSTKLVAIKDGSVKLGETAVDADGRWAIDLVLPDYRKYSIVAEVADEVGNVARSTPIAFTALDLRGPGGQRQTDAGGATYQVYRLYEAVFDRAADNPGLAYWTEQLTRYGKTLVDIVPGFLSSAEFQKTYGSKDNGAFVTLLYLNVLDRSPDAGGLRGWVDLLAGGQSRANVVLGFSESAEFKQQVSKRTPDGVWLQDIEAAQIARLYYATLDRAPDAGGLSYWTQQLEGSLSLKEITAGFTQSKEFSTKYGALSDSAFIDTLYENVLDRQPDAAGKANWLAALATSDRQDVVIGFSESAEFQTKIQPLLDNGFLLA